MQEDMHVSDSGSPRTIRSFVLRQARMSSRQRKIWDEKNSDFLLPEPEGILDFPSIFGNDRPVVLEIGFGMGHASARIAAANPDTNYLGVEVHIPGVAALIDRLQSDSIHNMKLLRMDAVELIDRHIATRSLSGVHIFFPDPWPKKKHNKRRLVQAEFAAKISTILLPGGYVYAVSDWQDYADQILGVFTENPDFENPSHGFCEALPWRPETSFERKAHAKSHQVREVWVRRR